MDCYGVQDNAALVFFNERDLTRLFFGGKIAMDDANAAFLGNGNRHAAFGDSIHGRGQDRNVETNCFCDVGRYVDLAGHDFRGGWKQ